MGCFEPRESFKITIINVSIKQYSRIYSFSHYMFFGLAAEHCHRLIDMIITLFTLNYPCFIVKRFEICGLWKFYLKTFTEEPYCRSRARYKHSKDNDQVTSIACKPFEIRSSITKKGGGGKLKFLFKIR